MNVIRFKLPANFEPKCKSYRNRRRIPRSAHTSPDTLFGLCELVLRRLLLPRVARRKFWPTVLSVLPGPESSRVRVRHQVEHPDDYNVHQRVAVTSVNDANHWDRLTEALRHETRWPRIRIGESARNRITRLHHALDYPTQQNCWQNRPYDMLTSAFIVRTAARIASLEQQRSLVRNRARSERTMTGTSTATTTVVTTPASSRRLSRATSVDVPDVREEEEEEDEDEEEQQQQQQQERNKEEAERRYYFPYHPPPLMVIGKRATYGHELRTKPIPPSVRLNQRKKPSR